MKIRKIFSQEHTLNLRIANKTVLEFCEDSFLSRNCVIKFLKVVPNRISVSSVYINSTSRWIRTQPLFCSEMRQALMPSSFSNRLSRRCPPVISRHYRSSSDPCTNTSINVASFAAKFNSKREIFIFLVLDAKAYLPAF